MEKKMVLFFAIVTVIFTYTIALAEEITLTTLYPAPYGAYRVLSVKNQLYRQGSTLFGNDEAISTHINLGIISITGTNEKNYKYCTVSGGYFNKANGEYSVVAGGRANVASSQGAVVSGGNSNNATGEYFPVIAGGSGNTANGFNAVVSGGTMNTSSGERSVVGGGLSNEASGTRSVVSGGYLNTAGGNYSVVPGGESNIVTVNASYSFAAGHGANANHEGCFIWADSQFDSEGKIISYSTTSNNEFRVRATGGSHFDSDMKIKGRADPDILNIPILTNAPSNPVEGDLYYNKTTNRLFLYIDNAWKSI